MALPAGIRNLITRKKAPIAIELTEPKAEGTPASGVSGAEAPAATATLPPESGSPGVGNDRVMSLLGEIDERLDTQGRLMKQVERLPQVADELAGVHQQCDELRALLGEHLESAKKREEVFGATVGRISEASVQEGKVLEVILQKLDSSTQAIRAAAELIEKIGRGISEVGNSSLRAQESVAKLQRSSEDREARLVEALSRWQRGIILAVVGCGTVSIVALVVAALALLM